MATTVDDYLAKLPADRRAAIAAVRDTINANLPAGYQEGIQYGMISWFVPLSVYPDTYNKQALALASLGSQKNYMVLHAMCAYGDPELDSWFRKAYAETGKKLDMGKGCIRFKTLEALPLEVVGQLVSKVPMDSYVSTVKATIAARKSAKGSAKTAVKGGSKTSAKAKTKSNAKPTKNAGKSKSKTKAKNTSKR